MSIHQISKIVDYVRYLQGNPMELEILFKEMLIGVTSFFRDISVWNKLREQVLPDLLNELPDEYVLRVWIAGCSTGEEAYSFAIIFNEAYEQVKYRKRISLQVFASDLDKDAIEIARKGVFNSSIVTDVTPERIHKYFTINETSYSVNTSSREMIVFAQQDVIKDPPFTKVDFLLCRNLLIYLESDLQKKLINLFHYSLREGGILLLGSAENVNSHSSLFSTLDTKLKLYKRSVTSMKIENMDFPNFSPRFPKRSQEEIPPVKAIENVQIFADQLLLQKFAPASVLINQEGDILYITGRTGKYLEPAAGKANMNIHAMAREGLRHELSGAIRKARQTYEPIILRNVKIENNGGTNLVNVTIQSTEKPDAFRGTIIIVFSDVANYPNPIRQKSKKGKLNNDLHENAAAEELQRTLDELQSTREEMLTSQEELKSLNEELQSTNEELQSTNEELTTSKEEMQSLNEELQTVNNELQSKVTEFLEANNDMTNLLNSLEIASLFLDRDLNIRRFTHKLTRIYKLRSSDIGRPFTEMVSDLQYPEIEEHAKEVLRSLIFREIDISTLDNRWFKVRIMPYRTFDDKIEGLVITFVDISVAKKLEEDLNKTIEILREHNLLQQ